MLQTDYESKVEFYCTNCAEKDQRIKELKEQLAEKNKEIMDWKDGSMIIQHEQQLALYKKALELACESVVKHEKRVDEEMGAITFFGETFDYDVNEFVEFYLQQAKEKVDEEKSNNCSI